MEKAQERILKWRTQEREMEQAKRVKLEDSLKLAGISGDTILPAVLLVQDTWKYDWSLDTVCCPGLSTQFYIFQGMAVLVVVPVQTVLKAKGSLENPSTWMARKGSMETLASEGAIFSVNKGCMVNVPAGYMAVCVSVDDPDLKTETPYLGMIVQYFLDQPSGDVVNKTALNEMCCTLTKALTRPLQKELPKSKSAPFSDFITALKGMVSAPSQ